MTYAEAIAKVAELQEAEVTASESTPPTMRDLANRVRARKQRRLS